MPLHKPPLIIARTGRLAKDVKGSSANDNLHSVEHLFRNNPMPIQEQVFKPVVITDKDIFEVDSNGV